METIAKRSENLSAKSKSNLLILLNYLLIKLLICLEVPFFSCKKAPCQQMNHVSDCPKWQKQYLLAVIRVPCLGDMVWKASAIWVAITLLIIQSRVFCKETVLIFLSVLGSRLLASLVWWCQFFRWFGTLSDLFTVFCLASLHSVEIKGDCRSR